MNASKRRMSSVVYSLIFSLIFVLVVVVVAVVMKQIYEKKNAAQLAELESIIYKLQSSIHVDSQRQYNIQKVIAIIDQYNVTLSHHQKYEIAEEIFHMSQKYQNLDVDLICATITHETGGTWDPKIISPAGAMGLMQIMPTTGMFVAAYEEVTWTSPEDILFEPIYNIRIGSRYLSSMIRLYNVEGGLAAYNGGERRAAIWMGSGKATGILADETQRYVPAVKRLYEEFQAFRL